MFFLTQVGYWVVIRIPKILVIFLAQKLLRMDTGQHIMARQLSVVAGVATVANIPAVVIASLLMCIACVVPVTSAPDDYAVVDVVAAPFLEYTSCCLCGLCCCCPVP